jgi:hypothetical protein
VCITADFSTGTLTDVVAVNDGLELINVYDKVVVYGTDGYTYSGWVDNPDVVANEMINRGWKSKNATEVKTWMDSYISQGDARGAVCLIMGVVTDTIAETQDSNCTLRKFLNVGGRVVWIGDWQLYYVAHSDGTLTIWGQNGSTNILGFTAMSDNVALSSITASGADWGLDFFWNNGYRPINQVDASVVLATNANNNASGWVTYFDSWSAGGFVRIWDYSVKTADLTSTAYGDLNDLAEYNFNYLYDIEGNRQSPQLDLSAIGTIESSSISWQETLNFQTITVETSVDGGSTWQTATNGGAIPNLPSDPTILDVRQVLSTTDTTVTPRLESLEVEVVSAYETTGYRISKPFDLSPAVEDGGSTISWQETTPTNTSITVETSTDDGATWDTATNGQPIPNLPTDLQGVELKYKTTLNATDTSITPTFDEVNIDVLTDNASIEDGTEILETRANFVPTEQLISSVADKMNFWWKIDSDKQPTIS